MPYENLRAFLHELPIRSMTGAQKFLALAVFVGQGDIKTVLEKKVVVGRWLKSELHIAFNDMYYQRAQSFGWVNPATGVSGRFRLTQKGLEHINDLVISADVGTQIKNNSGQSLEIFGIKKGHTFDKHLRGILAGAKKSILVADPYTADEVFDRILDAATPSVSIHLIFKKDGRLTKTRLQRFTNQFEGFALRQSNDLHDRFMIIDDQGYVLGPSMVDATNKSHAILVSLNTRDSKRLRTFFAYLWARLTNYRI